MDTFSTCHTLGYIHADKGYCKNNPSISPLTAKAINGKITSTYSIIHKTNKQMLVATLNDRRFPPEGYVVHPGNVRHKDLQHDNPAHQGDVRGKTARPPDGKENHPEPCGRQDDGIGNQNDLESQHFVARERQGNLS